MVISPVCKRLKNCFIAARQCSHGCAYVGVGGSLWICMGDGRGRTEEAVVVDGGGGVGAVRMAGSCAASK